MRVHIILLATHIDEHVDKLLSAKKISRLVRAVENYCFYSVSVHSIYIRRFYNLTMFNKNPIAFLFVVYYSQCDANSIVQITRSPTVQEACTRFLIKFSFYSISYNYSRWKIREVKLQCSVGNFYSDVAPLLWRSAITRTELQKSRRSVPRSWKNCDYSVPWNRITCDWLTRRDLIKYHLCDDQCIRNDLQFDTV